VPNDTPATVTGSDGKEYPATRPSSGRGRGSECLRGKPQTLRKHCLRGGRQRKALMMMTSPARTRAKNEVAPGGCAFTIPHMPTRHMPATSRHFHVLLTTFPVRQVWLLFPLTWDMLTTNRVTPTFGLPVTRGRYARLPLFRDSELCT